MHEVYKVFRIRKIRTDEQILLSNNDLDEFCLNCLFTEKLSKRKCLNINLMLNFIFTWMMCQPHSNTRKDCGKLSTTFMLSAKIHHCN